MHWSRCMHACMCTSSQVFLCAAVHDSPDAKNIRTSAVPSVHGAPRLAWECSARPGRIAVREREAVHLHSVLRRLQQRGRLVRVSVLLGGEAMRVRKPGVAVARRQAGRHFGCVHAERLGHDVWRRELKPAPQCALLFRTWGYSKALAHLAKRCGGAQLPANFRVIWDESPKVDCRACIAVMSQLAGTSDVLTPS